MPARPPTPARTRARRLAIVAATTAVTGALLPGVAAAATVAAPVVTDATPYALPTAGGTAITVTGRNLAHPTSVTIGGTGLTAAQIKSVSANELIVTAPAHDAGLVHIVVGTAGGRSATTRADVVEYLPPPAVAGLSAVTGPAGGGGRLTVTGSGFGTGTTVRFGTTRATGVTVASDSSLTVTVPAHAAGLVDVRVGSPLGTSTSGDTDHYLYGGPALAASPLPLPAGLTAGSDASVAALTCPAVGTCYAVGDAGYEHNGYDHPLIDVLAHGMWTSVPVAVPSGDSYARMTAIDCPSAAECYALGQAIGYDSDHAQFLMTLRSGTWTQRALPSDAAWSRVDCPAARQCVIAGGAGDRPSFLTLDGDTLTERAGDTVSGVYDDTVDGLTCLSLTSCVQWGSYYRPGTDFNDSPFAYAELLDASGWHAADLAADGGRDDVVGSDLQTVLCSAPGECTGYGNYLVQQSNRIASVPARATLSAGHISFDDVSVAYVPGAEFGQDQPIAPVACASATRCVGLATSVSTEDSTSPPHAFVDTLASDGWHPALFAPTSPAALDYSLTAAACTASAWCVVGGQRRMPVPEEPVYGYQAVLLLPSGSRYASVDLPQAGGAAATRSGVSACAPTGRFCVAVGSVQTSDVGGHYDYPVTITG